MEKEPSRPSLTPSASMTKKWNANWLSSVKKCWVCSGDQSRPSTSINIKHLLQNREQCRMEKSFINRKNLLTMKFFHGFRFVYIKYVGISIHTFFSSINVCLKWYKLHRFKKQENSSLPSFKLYQSPLNFIRKGTYRIKT